MEKAKGVTIASALARAIDEHRDAMLRIARSLCRASEDPEDVVQEVSLRLMRSPPELSSLDSPAAFLSWVRTAATRLLMDMRRAKQREASALGKIARRNGAPSVDARDLLLVGMCLTDDERFLVELMCAGHTQEGAAEIMGVSGRTVRRRVRRLRAKCIANIRIGTNGHDTGDSA